MSGDAVLIVGAGHAGVALAVALRDAGHEGEVTLLDRSGALPVQRPPLSKGFLTGAVGEAALALRPTGQYVAQRITRVHGEARSIDRAQRRLHLADGRALPYDALVLATGSAPRRLGCPGEDLAGVHRLRGLEDAKRLRDALRPGRRAVVVGGGWIGLEFARSALQRGVAVQVLEAAPRLLAHAVSAPLADALGRAHRAAGVAIACSTAVAAFSGEGGVMQAVRTTEGRRFEADLVLVAAGAVPETALAAQAGLALERGIAVDAEGRTEDPAIWALGDAAATPDPASGRRRVVTSVQQAVDGARALAARLCGKPVPPAGVLGFWSQQGDQRVHIFGLAEPGDGCTWQGDDQGGTALRWRDGAVVAVELLNPTPARVVAARRLLGGSARPTAAEAATHGFSA